MTISAVLSAVLTLLIGTERTFDVIFTFYLKQATCEVALI